MYGSQLSFVYVCNLCLSFISIAQQPPDTSIININNNGYELNNISIRNTINMKLQSTKHWVNRNSALLSRYFNVCITVNDENT